MKLKVLSHTKDGTVNVLIDGVRYEYLTDAAGLQSFFIMKKHSDKAALNLLKEIARDYRRIEK